MKRFDLKVLAVFLSCVSFCLTSQAFGAGDVNKAAEALAKLYKFDKLANGYLFGSFAATDAQANGRAEYINNRKKSGSSGFKIRALKICLLFSFVGYLFDSILGYTEIFNIKSNIMVGYMPIWFLVLWPSFTTLFVNVLVFLKNYLLLSFFIGSILAPPTYYLGIPLGIASSENIALAMTTMIIFWGCFLMLYSFSVKKINF